MAPTESVIWEAKHKPSSFHDTRRPSTTVEESGCIITKGFIIPSRTSSFDSVALSTDSSLETVGTPASPLEDAPPGFARPTGSLYHAPELQPIRTQSSTSLHRPTKSIGFGSRYPRSAMGDRRQTWQASGSSHSGWNTDELAATACKAATGFTMAAQPPLARRVPQKGEARQTQAVDPVPRTKSEHINLKDLRKYGAKAQYREEVGAVERPPGAMTNADQMIKSQQGQELHGKIASKAGEDIAIASDSEDEDDFLTACNALVMGGVAAQRRRPNYAVRRARRDELAAEQHQCQMAVPELSQHQQNLQRALEVASASQAENAMESDDEDDDYTDCKGDKRMSAALGLAQLHRSRNSVTAKIEVTSSNNTQLCKTSLSVKVARLAKAKFSILADEDDDSETPTEVKSFEAESSIPQRSLCPSKSLPKPVKGVLKQTGSQSSSGGESPPTKHATTAIRRGSGKVVDGRVRPSKPVSSMASDALK